VCVCVRERLWSEFRWNQEKTKVL